MGGRVFLVGSRAGWVQPRASCLSGHSCPTQGMDQTLLPPPKVTGSSDQGQQGCRTPLPSCFSTITGESHLSPVQSPAVLLQKTWRGTGWRPKRRTSPFPHLHASLGDRESRRRRPCGFGAPSAGHFSLSAVCCRHLPLDWIFECLRQAGTRGMWGEDLLSPQAGKRRQSQG